MEENRDAPLTFGERRVRINFNIEGNSVIDDIKIRTASLLDTLEAIKNDELSKTYDLSESQMRVISGEKLRLISLAQTAYEESVMWAVKAITC